MDLRRVPPILTGCCLCRGQVQIHQVNKMLQAKTRTSIETLLNLDKKGSLQNPGGGGWLSFCRLTGSKGSSLVKDVFLPDRVEVSWYMSRKVLGWFCSPIKAMVVLIAD